MRHLRRDAAGSGGQESVGAVFHVVEHGGRRVEEAAGGGGAEKVGHLLKAAGGDGLEFGGIELEDAILVHGDAEVGESVQARGRGARVLVQIPQFRAKCRYDRITLEGASVFSVLLVDGRVGGVVCRDKGG